MLAKLKIGLLLTCSLLAGGTLGYFQTDQRTYLSFLAVGQGDCTVFQHEGTTVLIDVGPESGDYNAGKRLILPWLRRNRVQSVDLIVLSHPDSDHIGGLDAIMHAYPHATVLVSAVFRNHPDLLDELKQSKIRREKVLWVQDEAFARVGKFKIRLECLLPISIEDDNEASAFVYLSDGSASAVFSGDAGKPTENFMLNKGDWAAEVMKVGHHGSSTSTSYQWLEVVKPKYAVISCGRANRFGHPHESVLNLLKAKQVEIYRTDLNGNARFVLKDGHFQPQ